MAWTGAQLRLGTLGGGLAVVAACTTSRVDLPGDGDDRDASPPLHDASTSMDATAERDAAEARDAAAGPDVGAEAGDAGACNDGLFGEPLESCP